MIFKRDTVTGVDIALVQDVAWNNNKYAVEDGVKDGVVGTAIMICV